VKVYQTMMIKPEDVLYSQDEVDKKLADLAKQPPQLDPALQIKVQIEQMKLEAAKDEAEMRRQTAIMDFNLRYAQLQTQTGLSDTEMKEKYGLEHRKIDSAERMKAADIAVEQARQQQGINPGEGIG
jgi:hypothetical protein